MFDYFLLDGRSSVDDSLRYKHPKVRRFLNRVLNIALAGVASFVIVGAAALALRLFL